MLANAIDWGSVEFATPCGWEQFVFDKTIGRIPTCRAIGKAFAEKHSKNTLWPSLVWRVSARHSQLRAPPPASWAQVSRPARPLLLFGLLSKPPDLSL